jgi:hypothetical protein
MQRDTTARNRPPAQQSREPARSARAALPRPPRHRARAHPRAPIHPGALPAPRRERRRLLEHDLHPARPRRPLTRPCRRREAWASPCDDRIGGQSGGQLERAAGAVEVLALSPSWGRSETQARGRRHHRRAPSVHRLDDLGVVDPLQLDPAPRGAMRREMKDGNISSVSAGMPAPG